jgi:zinc-ribbon domain
MTHQWKLSSGHQISVENEGAQTIVTVRYDSSGQQQRTNNSFTTGLWISPPEMVVMPTGAILKITTPTGISTIQVEGNSVRMQSDRSEDSQSNYSSSSSSSSTFIPNFDPLQPMQPMVMRREDLELNIGNIPQPKSFCTQCGTPVKSVDRFCSGCGHKLGS